MKRDTTPEHTTQTRIFNDQITLGADLAATLDFPLDPTGTKKQNMARIRRSLSNVKRAVSLVRSQKADMTIVPVLHGYDLHAINYCFEKLQEFEDEFSYHFPVVAIGSLVPLYADRSNAGSLRLMSAFHAVLQMVTDDRRIHVMGAGSPLSMRFYYWLGADSLDTRSWITNAVFGKVVIPGSNLGRLHVTELIRRFGHEAKLCGCPICEHGELEDLASSRMKRAFHNAFVYLAEFRCISQEFRDGTFEENTQRLFKNSKFFARMLKHVPNGN